MQFVNLADRRLRQGRADHDVIGNLVTCQTFGKAILPRRSWCDRLVPDLCVPKTLSELDGMIRLLSFVLALLASPFKSKLQCVFHLSSEKEHNDRGKRRTI